MSYNECALKEEIVELNKKLNLATKKLFINRLLIASIDEGNLENAILELKKSGIELESLEIEIKSKSSWNIKYIHKTLEYDENNYIANSDSENEYTTHPKTTHISFGFSKEQKYYIKGNKNKLFSIYKNGTELRIINSLYDLELDPEEQNNLIKSYITNQNIPEAFALKIFKHISRYEWDNEHVFYYLSCV